MVKFLISAIAGYILTTAYFADVQPIDMTKTIEFEKKIDSLNKEIDKQLEIKRCISGDKFIPLDSTKNKPKPRLRYAI
jgi:hypothetical protein